MKSSTFLSLASTVLTVVALALIILVPFCSIRSDPNHLSTLQFATIDASATKAKIKNNEYIGLPDPWDFSKHKQIYQMYLLNYCSGYKRQGSDRIVIDFCSKNGNELWDILSSWKMWGVSVRPDGAAKFEWLRRGPHWLWIVYLTAAIMLGLSTLGSFAMLHRWRRGKWILFGISAATSCALLGVAIACQVTYGALVARADDDKVSISAQMGKSVFAVNWLAAACSLCASVLLFAYCKQGPSNGKEKLKPNLGKFASESTSYKYESVKAGTELRVASATHTRSASIDGLHSRNSTESLVAEGRGRAQEREYDPYLSSKGNPDLKVLSASRSRSPSRERDPELRVFSASYSRSPSRERLNPGRDSV